MGAKVQKSDTFLIDILIEFEKVNKRVMSSTRRLGEIRSEIASAKAELAKLKS